MKTSDDAICRPPHYRIQYDQNTSLSSLPQSQQVKFEFENNDSGQLVYRAGFQAQTPVVVASLRSGQANGIISQQFICTTFPVTAQ